MTKRGKKRCGVFFSSFSPRDQRCAKSALDTTLELIEYPIRNKQNIFFVLFSPSNRDAKGALDMLQCLRESKTVVPDKQSFTLAIQVSYFRLELQCCYCTACLDVCLLNFVCILCVSCLFCRSML